MVRELRLEANISLISYGIAAVAYFVMSLLLIARLEERILGRVLLLAAAVTAGWAGLVAAGTLLPYPPVAAIQFMELLRNLGWLAALLLMLGLQAGGSPWTWMGVRWRRWLTLVFAVAVLLIAQRPLQSRLGIEVPVGDFAIIAVWTALAIAGLLVLEQIYRNAGNSERWALKFLCLGLGAVFAYDLFMYAEALLFRQMNAQLWQARGLVNALVVPWLLVAIARNKDWRMDLHVSRHVVFHTFTLFGAGLYLLAMAVVGYFIRYLGGSWGGVLQVSFLAGSGALLFTLLFSGNLRARLRVFLSKHFFSYRYDYRVEWLRFTEGLAALENVAEGAISTLATIVQSPGGMLVHKDNDGKLNAVASWEFEIPARSTDGNLERWIAASGWVVDVTEARAAPDLYDGLELPRWLHENRKLWLVVPLMFKKELEGLIFLARTDLKSSVNWEDRDLLKTAGRQAAALLAQQRASSALVEARQFDAFNRLSAYVIHDLKNILAQQSLMVANAKKHRDNPAFIDDMISTVENSVNRMQRLMAQMRSGMRGQETKPVRLRGLLEKVVGARSEARPRPVLQLDADTTVLADFERLSTVFTHLITNAQEATSEDGEVSVRLAACGEDTQVTITDSGSGMSEEFIREKLFRPFESTKGLTGMGIGAFESREYIKQLGGQLTVTSTPGHGSSFTVRLPVTDAGDEASEPALAGAGGDL